MQYCSELFFKYDFVELRNKFEKKKKKKRTTFQKLEIYDIVLLESNRKTN